MEQELNETRENHQYTVEELGSANDGLRSANEEMQSSNEELQSTNEELESSKEELQSLNEELNTVNSELQNNVEALTAANDDMRNLLNSTEVATIFVDNDLNIRRFTDRAAEIVNLIEGDVGRPLRHVSTNLSDDRLLADVEEVIDKLSPVEREVTTDGDEHFQLRVTPYRTVDNRIDGAVISFREITVQKQAQERLEQLNAEKQHAVYLARKVIDMNPQPLVVLNDDRTIVFANDAFGELVEADGSLEGRNLLELDEAFDSASDLRSTLDHAAEAGEDFGGMALTVGAGNGMRNYRISGRIVPWLEGERYRVLLGFAEEPNGEDHE